MDNGAIGSGILGTGPVNKHASVTQVKNGYILYSGSQTLVSYTFDELVKHLAETFGTPAEMSPTQPMENVQTANGNSQ